MDAIYSNSDLAIISAAGVDEGYGLPGVDNRDRPCQLFVNLQDVTVIWTPKDPQKSIAQSHWSTRGWTFQEAVFSPRRLFFTDDQMYFECNTMNCFESVYYPLDKLHVEDRSMTCGYLRSGLFGKNRSSGYGHFTYDMMSLMETYKLYRDNVEKYTVRNLRFDSDSPSAFQGILRRFSRQKFPLSEIWGLCYPQTSNLREVYFVNSLLWMHRGYGKRPRRCFVFPSWTWTGWEGQANWYTTIVDGIDFQSGLKSLRLRCPERGLTDLKDADQEGRYPILHVAAATVPIFSESYQPKKDSSRHWVVSECETTLYWSANSHTYEDFLESFTNTYLWHYIYIGKSTFDAYVMILQSPPETKTWQRVGLVEAKTLLRLVASEQMWRSCTEEFENKLTETDTFEIV